ncbi:uncharacterized protein LOC114721167 [Neltuma alba]|uniref:uncharacterized protein LOC114721167 n=1 Tax=Neltuma alba TaxID=207710 RepID=UPI0010A4D9EA|nr:uncharacterized protein LOC114721167 [Prosopis alba]
MEQNIDIPLTEKGERTPRSAGDPRTSKKVKIQDDEETNAIMDTDIDLDATRPASQRWEGIQKQLFNEEIPDSAASILPDNMDDDQVQKEPDSYQETPKPSFKDKLLNEENNREDDTQKEVTIEPGDVSIALEGLIPNISFSQRIKDLLTQNMKYAVVVKLLGRYIRQETLFGKIVSLWRPVGHFKLTELDGGCFMVKFSNQQDYLSAMLGGPWVVLGHYLTVHPWEPSFSPLNLEIKQVLGWVRLPGLPYHYYHKSVLRAIGGVIGEVLKIDYNTEGVDKARFARLAVKLDLTKPLVAKIKLDGTTQLVEYEGLPTICYHCGRYGHLEAVCPSKVQHNQPQQMHQNPSENPASNSDRTQTNNGDPARTHSAREESVFGAWMKAPSRGWRPSRAPKKRSDVTPNMEYGTNRFELLARPDETTIRQEGNPSASMPQEDVTPVYPDTPIERPKGNTAHKSTILRNKKPPRNVSPKKPQPPKSASDTIFDSPAYTMSNIQTSLDPTKHSAVTFSTPRQTQSPNTEQPKAHKDHAPLNPSIPAQLGKENILPKPPDRSPSKGKFKIQPTFKVKNLKPRTKEEVGNPSEELTRALAEALGAHPPSDDDTTFVEAAETGFEDDSASERAEMDH